MIKKFSVRDTIELVAGSTGIALVFGGWLYVDTYFAHAKDLKIVSITMEQSLIQLRIDVLENRIDRELEKCHEINDGPDQRKIDKMKNQIRRLEARQNVLSEKEI